MKYLLVVGLLLGAFGTLGHMFYRWDNLDEFASFGHFFFAGILFLVAVAVGL